MSSEFGDLLRQHRIDAKLSQTDLISKLEKQGYRVGNKGTISKWEHGISVPSDEVIEYLEDIFTVSKGTFFNAAHKPEMAAYRAGQVANNNSGLSHDSVIFRESDAILSEKDAKEITSGLENNLWYKSSQQLRILEYLSYFLFSDGTMKESTQYLNIDVRASLETVLRSLQDFLAFSDEYFDADNHGPDYHILLYPYHSDVLTNDEYDKLRSSGDFAPYGSTVDRYHAMLHPRIEKYVLQLKELVDEIDNCFRRYRKLVRVRLHV